MSEEQPTDEGRKRYTDGFYDGLPCTCKPECEEPCKGGCGCEACSNAYHDAIEEY